MFRIKQKVRIVSQPKSDGRTNVGIIVGIEIMQNGHYLGYRTAKEFYARFDGSVVQYQVAYIDCVTERACVDYYMGHHLAKYTKTPPDQKAAEVM